MLLKQRILDGLVAGTIDRAYRRWERARVKAGGRLRTQAGELAIDRVDEVSPRAITDDDARAAGYDHRDALLAELDAHGPGTIYCIHLRVAGADPRIALRARATMDDEELDALVRRLARLDAASRRGPWTHAVLEVIATHPEGTRAAELAAAIGRDPPSFKLDVRKLKELGLTESLETGYRLSPRGIAFRRHARGRAT
ncbi:hypothetical protein [Pendulispora albinea]|uniref:ASCH domain-containing protein n=1 Tax=Pendulispora albinea TaxID=2741071 RepID=A0ABZ2LPJ8_9BACT